MVLRTLLTVCVCAGAAAGGVGRAADLEAAAKTVASKYGPAIVPLKIVTSMKATVRGQEMPARENTNEVLGTVLDDTGLIVASNTAVDPAGSQRGARPGIEIDSEIKSAKLVRKDGTEHVLKIVLRDKDLDLTFLRPEKALDLPHLGLKAKGAELALADHAVVLSRLAAVGDRQVNVFVARVQAVVDKPRRFYVVDLVSSMAALGCPVFNADTELVGFVVIRTRPGAGPSGVLGGLGSRLLPTVLPAADVVDVMQQAKEGAEG
jgi:hypothetical protein